MVKVDYLYAANWSLWNDLKILLRTLRQMLGRRGVCAEDFSMLHGTPLSPGAMGRRRRQAPAYKLL